MRDVKVSPGPFQCLLCGAKHSRTLLGQCSDTYLRKPFIVDYHVCGECGLVQQHPMPFDVAPFYDGYPIHQSKGSAYTWLRHKLLTGAYVPPRHWAKGARLLDFGCGDGWYLKWCIDSGLDAAGFEPSMDHAASLSKALGVHVYHDMHELLAVERGSFDIITLNFVAEHLTQLPTVIGQMSTLLRPGGQIRFVVPAIDSWEFRWFGRNWHSLDAPRHVIFPEQNHARVLAAESGLNLTAVAPASFPNGFAGSLATFLTGRFNPVLFALSYPLAWLVTRWFSSGNCAYVLSRPQN